MLTSDKRRHLRIAIREACVNDLKKAEQAELACVTLNAMDDTEFEDFLVEVYGQKIDKVIHALLVRAQQFVNDFK